jgi:hypothetical protein
MEGVCPALCTERSGVRPGTRVLVPGVFGNGGARAGTELPGPELVVCPELLWLACACISCLL